MRHSSPTRTRSLRYRPQIVQCTVSPSTSTLCQASTYIEHTAASPETRPEDSSSCAESHRGSQIADEFELPTHRPARFGSHLGDETCSQESAVRCRRCGRAPSRAGRCPPRTDTTHRRSFVRRSTGTCGLLVRFSRECWGTESESILKLLLSALASTTKRSDSSAAFRETRTPARRSQNTSTIRVVGGSNSTSQVIKINELKLRRGDSSGA